MQRAYPRANRFIGKILSSPLLFLDTFKWALFRGGVVNGKLLYKDVRAPYCLEGKLLDGIKQGNKIQINKKRIVVYSDDKIIFTYNKKDDNDGTLLTWI